MKTNYIFNNLSEGAREMVATTDCVTHDEFFAPMTTEEVEEFYKEYFEKQEGDEEDIEKYDFINLNSVLLNLENMIRSNHALGSNKSFTDAVRICRMVRREKGAVVKL